MAPGSSRDWAAKGPKLLGIQAVIAESYERIHRSNLVGMGILPLQFEPGQTVESLGLTGEELYTVESPAEGLADRLAAGRRLIVVAERADGSALRFPVDHPDRHAPGGPLLRERRDPAVRAQAIAQGLNPHGAPGLDEAVTCP